MRHQKQHTPKRFEGLDPSEFYTCRVCGIKYLGLESFTRHQRAKHNKSLDQFIIKET